MTSPNDDITASVVNSDNLMSLIQDSKNVTIQCDKNDNFVHRKCISTGIDNDRLIPQCPSAFQLTIVELLASKPKLFEEKEREEVTKYYDRFGIKAVGFISLNHLIILNDKSKSPTLTWLKFENLISLLIKRNLYEPKVLANEILTLVRDEIPPCIASRLASVLDTCVKYCREVSKSIQDEEEEEKWCEIIEWMSWFIGSSDQL